MALYSVYYGSTKLRKWSSKFGISFSAIRMLLLFVAFVISLYLDIVRSNILNVLFTNTGSILNYIEREFKVTISMHSMIRSMHSKILATYMIQAFMLAINLILNMFSSKSSVNLFSTKAIFAYRDFMAVYYVIFIDLLTLILRSLNEGIDRVTIRKESITVKLQTMHKTKWVYYNLWKTSRIYSRRFVSAHNFH